MDIIDISMPLREGMIVYPGNPEFKHEWFKRIPEGSSNLSKITAGLHTGTHVDAPLHVHNNGDSVDQVPLDHFYGDCQVIDCTSVPFGEGIKKEHLLSADKKIVLLKTKNSATGFKEFKKDFVFLTEEGAEHLVSKGVVTVGIDYLSIQKYHTGYCASHCVLLDKGISIYEGLDLSKVEQGFYKLSGLPLRVEGAEASLARVVLIK